MSMYTLLRNNPLPTQAEMESAFEGEVISLLNFNLLFILFLSFENLPFDFEF